ncbi:hypothetical protein BD311DRAFT_672945 [Dichomitus squalens]|uniref:Uncharacterized protein n=1 Tax=Dichomitus squalens TaxID=114155 RepID=A0A4Q9M9U1_9APHY|nr:hypothetical protein BD311DRAFT_672945 [Dichomitus squalens]
MRLCSAVPDSSPRCTNRAVPSFPFCSEHAAEHHVLEERIRMAAREVERLKPIAEDMVAEGTTGYTGIREIRRDARVVRLYMESLDGQINAAVALRTKFPPEEKNESENVLQEKKGNMVAFLAGLEERARELEIAQLGRPHEDALSQASDAPPAYPILDAPHPPYACTKNNSDDRPGPRNAPQQCTALRRRDGKPCTWKCVSGQRFCAIHCVAHPVHVFPIRMQEGLLDVERSKVVQGQGEASRRMEEVKSYIGGLAYMETAIAEHQRVFLCGDTESHAALLRDLSIRRTRAAMLLGQLMGRQDARIAEEQGQTETWAAEFLAEVRQRDAAERGKVVEDLVIGATVSGASLWFGVPWARSMIYGAVTTLVSRSAREKAA